MMLNLDMRSNVPIYEQIITQMKYDVMKGYLKAGDDIPSVRKLALDLGITPGTVAKAYQELERQHIIETIRGKGTYISQNLVYKFDEDKLQNVLEAMKAIVLELIYTGYGKEKMLELISSMYDEVSGPGDGGNNDRD